MLVSVVTSTLASLTKVTQLATVRTLFFELCRNFLVGGSELFVVSRPIGK